MEKARKDILFIVNPKAGITIKSKFLIRLLAGQYLDQDRFNPEVQFTRYATHATELAADAVKQGIPIVIAVGGDGTVNEVARALVHTETVMGILPTGSGNGLAHHLKIPMSLIKALQVINKCNARAIDTVDLNGKIFTSIAGIGFDAAVAEKFASSGVRGLLSYVRIILQEYRNYPPGLYTLHIDGAVYPREALMISFANSDQFGFHSRIAPQAMIDDGWLDICVVSKPAFHKIIFAAPRVFFGTFGKTGYAEYFRGKQVFIPETAGQKVNLDGEAIQLDDDLRITVKPKSLRIIVR